jgi:hypothetical protein
MTPKEDFNKLCESYNYGCLTFGELAWQVATLPVLGKDDIIDHPELAEKIREEIRIWK